MNCHMAINEYTGKDKIYKEDGTEVNGTAEIQKLYKYAGLQSCCFQSLGSGKSKAY